MKKVFYNPDGVIYDPDDNEVFYEEGYTYHYPFDLTNSDIDGYPIEWGGNDICEYVEDHNGTSNEALILNSLGSIFTDDLIFENGESIYGLCFWMFDSSSINIDDSYIKINNSNPPGGSVFELSMNINYQNVTALDISSTDGLTNYRMTGFTSGWTFMCYTYDGTNGNWYIGDNNNEPSLFWTSPNIDATINNDNYDGSQLRYRTFDDTSKPIHDIFVWIGSIPDLDTIKFYYNNS